MEVGKNDNPLKANWRDGTPFYFLDMFPVDISAYNLPSPFSSNTLVEESARKQTPQEYDHEEEKSE